MKKLKDVCWFTLYTLVGGESSHNSTILATSRVPWPLSSLTFSEAGGRVRKRAFKIFKSYVIRNFWQKIKLGQIGPIQAWLRPECVSELSKSWLGLWCSSQMPVSPAQETSWGHHSELATFRREGAQIPPHVFCCVCFFFSPVRWRACRCGEFMI